jgi:hypothetical protein
MQKPILLLLLFISLFTASCNKIEEVEETPATNGKVLFTGTFASAAHPTSGTVEVLDVNGVKKLSFKNLKSDAGPDLRIYLAQDLAAKTFTEISNKVNNGTYSVDLPSSVDPAKNKFVLIWCKQFSVLFGSAELK